MVLSKKQTLICLFALILMVLAPLVGAEYPHLLDVPSHLARIKIISEYPTNPFYQNLYDLNFDIIPNLALDMFVLSFEKYLPIIVLAKIFVGISFFITLSGVVFLNYSIFGKLYLWPLFSSLFLYNLILQFGFINYLMGVGLVFWGVFIYINYKQLSVLLRLVICVLICVFLFFCHIVSLAIFIAIIFSLEISNTIYALKRNEKIAFIDILICFFLVIILAIYSLYFAESTNIDQEFFFKGVKSKFKVAIFNISWSKGMVDITMFLGLLLMSFYVILGKGIIIDKRYIFSLGILVLCYFIAPFDFGNGRHLDTRLPIVILLLFISISKIKNEEFKSNHLFIILLFLCLTLRSFFILQEWKAYDQKLNLILSQLKAIPEKSTLILASDKIRYPNFSPYGNKEWLPPGHHGISYALLNRTIFIPNIWARPSQHIIRITDIGRPLYLFQRNGPVVIKSSEELLNLFYNINKYNKIAYSEAYVVFLKQAGVQLLDSDNSALVTSSNDIEVYRVPNESN